MGSSKIKWQSGKVDWFDESSGRGFVLGDDGNWYFVHYSAIKSNSKWKTLNKNSSVKFTLFEDAGYKRVDKVREA